MSGRGGELLALQATHRVSYCGGKLHSACFILVSLSLLPMKCSAVTTAAYEPDLYAN